MSSGFISENELAERRRVRQEEWEKVRLPDQPKEAPEEEYDHRSLFERLEEQKKKKELEYEETHKLKNMIKGLDDDEVEFLDLVDRSKMEEEKKKTEEERREIADFRNKVATLQEQSLEQRIKQEIRQPLKANNNIKVSSRTSQQKLLAGAVIKKRPAETSKNNIQENPSKKSKSESQAQDVINESGGNVNNQVPSDANKVTTKESLKIGSLTCVGILPGVGTYDVSSDESDCSTDIEEDRVRYDLCGRRIKSSTTRSEDSSDEDCSMPCGRAYRVANDDDDSE